MKTFQSACTLDCWDACSMNVTVDGHNRVQVSGDPEDPITQGFLCAKGQQIVQRFQNPERLLSPLKRTSAGWETISWQVALDEIGTKMSSILTLWGPHSLIHYSEGGHGGLSKNIDTAFFNALGGVTTPTGSLCWGAGMAAQKLDFGSVYCHPPEDLENTQCLILWGRNPVETNIHLVPFIRHLKKQGIPVYLVDPIKSASTSLADEHLALRPGSDGHLALAMAKYLVQENLLDHLFLEQYTHRKEDFLTHLQSFSMDSLIDATGLRPDQVAGIATAYGKASPGCIYLGYGIQRNGFGGRNVRFIDALGALTGTLGVRGGGVNYAHRHISQWIDNDYLENASESPGPSFPRAHFAGYVQSQPQQSIQGIFVSKANPILQLPDTTGALQAFRQIPFKVVIDHFLTDTAQEADYVLPPTMILEESDVVFSSMWHNGFTWTEQVVNPPEDVRHEFEIFQALAERLKMTDFIRKYPDLETYLSTSIAPLCTYLKTTALSLKGKRIRIPGNELPWHHRQFDTPTGRFTFQLPDPNGWMPLPLENDPAYPLQLLTVHTAKSLHSQHLRTLDSHAIPEVQVHPATADSAGLKNGDRAQLTSPNGSLTCVVKINPSLQTTLLVMKQGTWRKMGP